MGVLFKQRLIAVFAASVPTCCPVTLPIIAVLRPCTCSRTRDSASSAENGRITAARLAHGRQILSERLNDQGTWLTCWPSPGIRPVWRGSMQAAIRRGKEIALDASASILRSTFGCKVPRGPVSVLRNRKSGYAGANVGHPQLLGRIGGGSSFYFAKKR